MSINNVFNFPTINPNGIHTGELQVGKEGIYQNGENIFTTATQNLPDNIQANSNYQLNLNANNDNVILQNTATQPYAAGPNDINISNSIQDNMNFFGENVNESNELKHKDYTEPGQMVGGFKIPNINVDTNVQINSAIGNLTQGIMEKLAGLFGS